MSVCLPASLHACLSICLSRGSMQTTPRYPWKPTSRFTGGCCKVQQRLRPRWRGSIPAPSRWPGGQRGMATPAHAVHPLPGSLLRPLVVQTPGLHSGQPWTVLPTFPQVRSNPGDVLPSPWVISMQEGRERLLDLTR